MSGQGKARQGARARQGEMQKYIRARPCPCKGNGKSNVTLVSKP